MSRPLLFEEALAQGARAVEAALELLLPPADAYPAVIHEAMRYSTLGGGKRLRGILVREAARLGREFAEPQSHVPLTPSPRVTPEAMQAAGGVGALSAAVEMIHAYSLVHDDLPCMDDDDMRRGRPTTHKVFGEGMAVLAGDALLTRAFEVLGRLPWAGVSPGATLAVTGEIAVAAGTAGLVGGQVADLQAEGSLAATGGTAGTTSDDNRRGPDARELLSFIHAHKTGALFEACLRSGAILGGLDEAALAQVTEYARGFGIAFQIVDDLLDVEGDAGQLGKKTGRDERKGKLTYPALYGLDASRRMAREQVERAKAALVSFGEAGRFLRELAEFVIRRER